MNPPWQAGAAAVVITPPEPMWLAGWAARRQPASGKALDLFAKALALEDASGARAVIVSADLIAIPRELAGRVAAGAQARWNLPRANLLFNASHTHTGPEVRPDKAPFFEIPPEFAARIEPYVAGLEEKILSAIGTALETLEPAALAAHQFTAGFAVNRRAPGGVTDRDVPVLEIADQRGRPRAILFGYACHNLTLPPGFCEFHGDYAGVAQQRLEEAFPGATALFLAGAGADQNPSPRGTVELAEQHGQSLAEAVAAGLAAGGRAVSGALRAAYEEVELDLQPPPTPETLAADLKSDDAPRRRKAAFLLDALAKKRPLPTRLLCPVQVLAFGNELLLVALGGEPVAEFARRFKADFAGPLVWVAGYSNDLFGYLPTRRVLQEGGYEGGRATLWSALPSPLAASAEDRVVDAVQRLVHTVGF
jgi:neutral ceramidase